MRSRFYLYTVAAMVVRSSAALASVLERTKKAGFDIIDFDEINRRLVLRGGRRLAPLLRTFVEEYAASGTFEVKAVARGAERLSLPQNAKKIRIGSRLLFYYRCNDGWAVWGEARGGSVLLKLCRPAINVDPAQMPMSLCAFDLRETERLQELITVASECFAKVLGRE